MHTRLASIAVKAKYVAENGIERGDTERMPVYLRVHGMDRPRDRPFCTTIATSCPSAAAPDPAAVTARVLPSAPAAILPGFQSTEVDFAVTTRQPTR